MLQAVGMPEGVPVASLRGRFQRSCQAALHTDGTAELRLLEDAMDHFFVLLTHVSDYTPSHTGLFFGPFRVT